MYAAGRSPSAGPGQSGILDAQASRGNISAFFSGRLEKRNFTAWRFHGDWAMRAISTSSRSVEVGTGMFSWKRR